jgi:translation initiation factor 1A
LWSFLSYWNVLEEESIEIIALLFLQTILLMAICRGLKMGKRKITNEGSLDNMILPSPNDVLGVAVKMLGAERVTVKCQDGKERLCRVRGKLKRRVWIREGDIVLVSPWDFQKETRGDIFWRYRKNQSDWLRNHNYLTM